MAAGSEDCTPKRQKVDPIVEFRVALAELSFDDTIHIKSRSTPWAALPGMVFKPSIHWTAIRVADSGLSVSIAECGRAVRLHNGDVGVSLRSVGQTNDGELIVLILADSFAESGEMDSWVLEPPFTIRESGPINDTEVVFKRYKALTKAEKDETCKRALQRWEAICRSGKSSATKWAGVRPSVPWDISPIGEKIQLNKAEWEARQEMAKRYFVVRPSSIKHAGIGVFYVNPIPATKGTVLDIVHGIPKDPSEKDEDNYVFLVQGGKSITVRDSLQWIRYVNCAYGSDNLARDRGDRHNIVVHDNGLIYALKTIRYNDEIFSDYGSAYWEDK